MRIARGWNMNGNEPSTIDFASEDSPPERPFLALAAETESINLTEVLTKDLTSSGSFLIAGLQETFFGKLLEALPISALLIDKSSTIRFANQSWVRFSGGHQKLEDRSFSSLFMNVNSARDINFLVKQVFDDRKPRVSVEKLLISSNQVWARIYLRSVRVAGERLVLCLAEDLTYEKRQLLLMDGIKRAKTEWEQTVDTVPESIALVDSDHRIIRMNRAMADRAGCTVQSAIKEPCYKIVHGRERPPYFCPFSRVVNDREERHIDYFDDNLGAFLKEYISPIKGKHGTLRSCVIVIQDVTQQKKLEGELHRYATRDELTNLFNRRQTLTLLDAACETAGRYKRPLSLAICDVDYFKKINDEHGHSAGDEMLRFFGKVIHKELRGADIAGRYGGDEFLMIFPNTPLEGAAQSLDRVRVRLEQTVFKNNGGHKITFSAGVAQFALGMTPEIFIHHADEALYKAKRLGRNRVVIKTD
jgi:diguanylate cyclase (GGDEF)-like protein/PAS domain S-box-containing protein